jgi:hypothetical protein
MTVSATTSATAFTTATILILSPSKSACPATASTPCPSHQPRQDSPARPYSGRSRIRVSREDWRGMSLVRGTGSPHPRRSPPQGTLPIRGYVSRRVQWRSKKVVPIEQSHDEDEDSLGQKAVKHEFQIPESNRRDRI